MFSKNKQKRMILIFTGSASALVGVALLVTGVVFISDTGDLFGYLMLLLGLFIMWISFREFKEYHQLKREFEKEKK
ncbi:hypothetical protein [Corticicoccus populi]|uniref:Uncharacterized protein n=1 Tax=Corticicoccus populi TaxID=1812821 RepID=A0ABW5WX05_9STAP